MIASFAFIFVALLCCETCISSQLYRDLNAFRLCKNQVPRRLPSRLKDTACAHADIDSYQHVVSCLKTSMPSMESAEMSATLCASVVSTLPSSVNLEKNISTPLLTYKYLYV